MSTQQAVDAMANSIKGNNGNGAKAVAIVISTAVTVLGFTLPAIGALMVRNQDEILEQIQNIVAEQESARKERVELEKRIIKREADAYTNADARAERLRVDDRIANLETLAATVNEKLNNIGEDVKELRLRAHANP